MSVYGPRHGSDGTGCGIDRRQSRRRVVLPIEDVGDRSLGGALGRRIQRGLDPQAAVEEAIDAFFRGRAEPHVGEQ